MKYSKGNAVMWVIVLFAIVLLGWYFLKESDVSDIDTNTGIDGTTTEDVTNRTVIDINNLPLVGSEAVSDEVVIESPTSGSTVSSPITLTGRARGSWYFEASAPVSVMDATGEIIGNGYVTANGEWMTTEFVPFSGTITFDNVNNAEGGAIVFMNDNPSGDESRAKYVAIPVYFR
ncbi:MAG: Gmad2 immunoglobulin-like domain-containing protein [Minisyncoccota bacterium]